MNASESRAGVAYGFGAYIFWGLMPLYWQFLTNVRAVEVTVHRILWSALFVGILILAKGRVPFILQALRDRRLVATLALTGTLIGINWGVFMWSVENSKLVQTSLGYYINPLLSIALGVILLGEPISPLRRVAVALAALAVAVQTAAAGEVPFVSLILASTFALYGYFRKKAAIGAIDGMFIEAALLFPLMLGLIVYWAGDGTGAFLVNGVRTDVLLILGGPLTAVPLMLFSAAARRIYLSTLGFIQYVAPTLILIQATLLFGERFTGLHAVTFGCVWLALALVAVDGTTSWFKIFRTVRPKPSALPPPSERP